MKYIVTSALGLIIVASSLFYYVTTDMTDYFSSPLPNTAPVFYEVKSGVPFQKVTQSLAEKGLITRPYYFDHLADKTGKANDIKTGEYRVEPNLTPLELLDLFVSGKVIQYPLTLVEGWSTRQVMMALKQAPKLQHTLIDKSPEEVLLALGIEEDSIEGLFLPETYYFPAGTSDVEFLRRAHQALLEVLEEEWENRSPNLPYKRPYDALKMGALIEKEAGLLPERAKIAGVFIRRLNKGMRLQSDPTVIYALGETYDGNIRKQDLMIDSPYNTYRYAGLPPSPIALVGHASLIAALHPELGSALYFVARGDGGHHFSDNLKAHNRAVAKYQLNRNRQKSN